MPDIALRLDGISRHYGKVKAVDNLSIDIPSGAFVTLLGPSGCGKSTTLNLIAGLDRLDEGRILLGNDDITFTPPNERRMAMVFQNYALYPHLNAYDNIAFGLKLQHRPAAEVRTRVNAVAAALDIIHLLNRRPGQMSGGQQQRVALGRALVKEPLVFLLDEPFSNLDAGLRSRMRTEVKHLHLKLGTTSVFVTHDQEEAMSLSDLIAVMRDGKVVQLGPTREIYRNPCDLYVATFVGKPKMSLVDGALERSNGEVTFVSPDLRISLGSPTALGLHDGDWTNVALGVRAEDVTVRFNGSAGSPVGSFGATVQLLEPIGSDTFVELASGDATVVARVAPDVRLDIGQTVEATIAPERIHVFDREGGQRIIH
jgi:ABC-type sugar transport system ATPase subunit